MSLQPFVVLSPHFLPLARRASVILSLLGSGVALTVACGAQSADSQSTNTGNPPLIDQTLIRIERVADGVRVTGEEGAVTPGGADVEVVNATSGESTETQADADGSFAAELKASETDEIRVEVTNESGSASAELSEENIEEPGCDGADDCAPTAVTAEEINAKIDELNHCEVVADCEIVGFPLCSSSYIHKDADRTELDAMITEFFSGQEIGCDASCACGLLECVNQRCTARASDCMQMPEGTVMTCL